MLCKAAVAASAFSAVAFMWTTGAEAVVINDLFAPSITSESNAAQVEAGITQATSHIGSLYSNPTTVNILFESAPGDFLGQTKSTLYHLDTAAYDFVSAIESSRHPENLPLAEGVAHLSSGNGYPESNLLATSADLRALGLNAPGGFDTSGHFVPIGGVVDAVIVLSSTLPIDFGAAIPAYNGSDLEFSGVNLVEHEVNEALGAGGAGSNLNNIYVLQTGGSFGSAAADEFIGSAVGVLDRFRYARPGVPSFTTSPSASAYFSLDAGVTDLAQFNQDPSGDFGDLGPTGPCTGPFVGGPAAVVQDAFLCNNVPTVEFRRGSIEDIMLQSIGWDPVPEPGAWVFLMLALFGAGAALRASRPFAAGRADRGVNDLR